MMTMLPNRRPEPSIVLFVENGLQTSVFRREPRIGRFLMPHTVSGILKNDNANPIWRKR